MAGLWDDATAPFTGGKWPTGQAPQDSSSLWGWLSSLFQRGQSSAIGNQPQPPVPTYTGPGVDPSLYPGAVNWSAGVPASLQYAPPSLYTAANPQQQALWNQASTPQGWSALATAPSPVPVVGGGGGLLQVPLPQRKPPVPNFAPPAPGAEGAPRTQPGRNISDEEIARLTPGNIRGVLSRSDLTAADNAALEARLNAMLRGM